MDKEAIYFIKMGNASEKMGLHLAAECLDQAIFVTVHPYHLLSTYIPH